MMIAESCNKCDICQRTSQPTTTDMMPTMHNQLSVKKEILVARKEEVHVDDMDVYGMTTFHMAALW